MFRSSQRQRIIKSSLEEDRSRGGAGLGKHLDLYLQIFMEYVDLADEVAKGVVSKVFPIQEDTARNLLYYGWVKSPFKVQPIHKIKNYFGEQLGFYFAFLGIAIKSRHIMNFLFRILY
jgi:hypothetical protein